MFQTFNTKIIYVSQRADETRRMAFNIKFYSVFFCESIRGEDEVLTLSLLALGSDENFYRDLKQAL
jgi:hypothetical protein